MGNNLAKQEMKHNMSNTIPLMNTGRTAVVAIFCLAMLLTACRKKPEGEITVITNPVTEITANTAVSGGTVSYTGVFTIGDCGVCCDEYQNPTIDDNYTEDGYGEGSFTSKIKQLKKGTQYYVRAYARTSSGIIYGNEVTFSTPSVSSDWVYYGDGTYYTSWGYTNGGTFTWASMFPASMLTDYAGCKISKVKVYAGEVGSYHMTLYEGGNTAPGTSIVSYYYSPTVTGERNFLVTPNESIDVSKNLWVVLSFDSSAGQYPAGAATGVDNPNARWFYNSDTWSNDKLNDKDFCWFIQVYLTDESKGQEFVLSYTNSENNNSTPNDYGEEGIAK